MPLLHVRPDGCVWNRQEAQGEGRSGSSSRGSNIVVTRYVVLGPALQQRRSLSFHSFGIGFVSVGMFIEDAVAEDIIGKADARCWIEQMSLQTTGVGVGSDDRGASAKAIGAARTTALHQTVQGVANYLVRGVRG